MSKHTPGPWEAAHIDDEVSARQFWVTGPDSFVCTTQDSDNPEANARLIAAAPELLEFVAEYMEAFENGMAGDSYLLRIAKAVHAKATGEA